MLVERMRALDRWRIAGIGAGIVVGPLAGALVVRKPSLAIILCLAIVAVVALDVLGDRALPWILMAFVVAPWYPMTAAEVSGTSLPPPIVKQSVLCGAIVLAPLLPWLWGIAARPSWTPRSRFAPLFGMLFVSLFVLVYLNKTTFSDLITSGVVGFLFAGVTFLCARRNARAEDWLAPCFAGLMVLILLGFLALAQAPGTRIGAFTGYAITYGALLAGLLPGAVAWAARRSLPLAFLTVALALTMEILSRSRSSWVATLVMLLLVMLLLARRGNVRAFGTVIVSAAIVVGLGLSIGPLHKIISERLNEKKNRNTDSVVHRTWSVSFATGEIRRHPMFGHGQPGFAGKQSGQLTGINAIDNGFLSITVDLGLLGLLAVLTPILFALRMLGSVLLRRRGPPTAELALALGIVGLAVDSAFYDGFYWAQINLLLFAFGGVLSTRFASALPAFARSYRGQALARRRRVPPELSGGGATS
jgi:O-antigen ligase